MGRNTRSGRYAWEIEDYQDLRPFITMLSHGDYFEKQDAAYVLRCFFMKQRDRQETAPAQLLENLIVGYQLFGKCCSDAGDVGHEPKEQ